MRCLQACGPRADLLDAFCYANHDENGGARRNRTDDLLHAMQALSQLSYGPICGKGGNRVSRPSNQALFIIAFRLNVVRVGFAEFIVIVEINIAAEIELFIEIDIVAVIVFFV